MKCRLASYADALYMVYSSGGRVAAAEEVHNGGAGGHLLKSRD
jgi:hypothetical protein